MDRVFEKLKEIDAGTITKSTKVHPDYWSDLKTLGLAHPTKKELSDLGIAALQFFRKESDSFKREHFILSNIRRRTYDISEDVFGRYQIKVRNLEEFLRVIPRRNGNQLLQDEHKLTFTECLNTFPSALRRYFQLSPDRQSTLDHLGEQGLKSLFDPKNTTDAPYAKVATRFLNVWRGLVRRTTFVKSYLLSSYEDQVVKSKTGQASYTMPPIFLKIITKNSLRRLIAESTIVSLVRKGRKRVLRSTPYHHVRRSTEVTDTNIFTRGKWKADAKSQLATLDPADRQRALDILHERTREHDLIVKKVCEQIYDGIRGLRFDKFSFDLLAERGRHAILHEIKTIKTRDRADEKRQVMRALGQLLYYEHFDVPTELKNQDAKVHKIAVFQRRLFDPEHIRFLHRSGIGVLWMNSRGEIHVDEHARAILKAFRG
jgi:hypothetical protein